MSVNVIAVLTVDQSVEHGVEPCLQQCQDSHAP